MVYCCCCYYCENYNICCNYKFRNTFNYSLYNGFICTRATTECFFKNEKDRECPCCDFLCYMCIIFPIIFSLDIIIYPFHYYFNFCKYCECKKIKIDNKNIKPDIIIEIPPSYNQHYGHSTIVQEIITMPPSYQEEH